MAHHVRLGRASLPATEPPAIRAEGVSKWYRKGVTTGWGRYRSVREGLAESVGRLRRPVKEIDKGRQFWALRDVSFEIGHGERVGVIGRNGAGKTTLLKILAETTAPSTGRIELRGGVGALLEIGTGFHPELTGRDNIFMSAAIHGKRRSEIREKLDEIVDFAEVGDFLDTPVKRYSTGMYLKLAFAVAAHLEPDILLIDEVLAVGDAEFRKKCLRRMTEIADVGTTVVFVSHDIPSVTRLCDRVMLLDQGRLVADGPPAEVVRLYLKSRVDSTAHRRWEFPEHAPGDAVARLKSVRVLAAGSVAREVDIEKPVEVEVEYWHLGVHDVDTLVTLRFVSPEGTCLFSTSDLLISGKIEAGTGGRSMGERVVRSTCHVPGNLLADGEVRVHVIVWSVGPTTVHAQELDAVSFLVVDHSEGDGARGWYRGDWPGVVRPLLSWRVDTYSQT